MHLWATINTSFWYFIFSYTIPNIFWYFLHKKEFKNTFQLSSLQRLGSLFVRLLTIILVFESCTYLVYSWIYWSNVAFILYCCFLVIQQSDISHFSKCCDDKGIWHVFINQLTDISISFIRKVVFVLLLECRFRVFFCLNS